MRRPLVSAIMGTLDEEVHIRACLDALLAQRGVEVDEIEILIADGGSKDRTRAILDRHQRDHPQIRWFDNPAKIAPAAWNLCLDQARGDVIILMGAHTVVNDDFVCASLQVLDEHPDAGAVGGRVHTVAQGYVAKAAALALSSPFGVGNAAFRYADSPRYVETVAFGAYPKSVFETVGPFDPSLVRNADWEFNYRLKRAGLRLFFSPDIQSTYYSRTSLGKLSRQQFQTSFEKVKVIRKHPGSLLWRHVIPSLFVVGLVVGLAFGVASRAVFILWLLMLAAYAGLSLAFSGSLALKNGWRYLPILPFVFLTIHLSYGAGLIGGWLRYLAPGIGSLDERPS